MGPSPDEKYISSPPLLHYNKSKEPSKQSLVMKNSRVGNRDELNLAVITVSGHAKCDKRQLIIAVASGREEGAWVSKAGSGRQSNDFGH